MRFPTLFVFVALVAVAGATPNRKVAAVRATVAPKIDGQISPGEWDGAAKFVDFVELASGKKMPEDAEVYAYYDAENLYFGFKCPDSEPKLIRRQEYRRNVRPEGDDQMIVILNPFANHQRSEFTQFNIGAGGGVSAAFAGGKASKREWEGAWDAKVRLTEAGWEGELIVPWKVLRLPSPGVRDIEVNFARDIPRLQHALSWCELGTQSKLENNGFMTGVEIPSIPETKSLLALPYQIVGYDQDKKDEIVNTGLDLRYDISPQMTALGTINPDFRNVEGAVLNLSFSRFERLAKERRPFFVEGQQFFGLGGMSAQLFAPQRISTMDFGTKVFGKLSDTQSFGGMFLAQMDHHTAGMGTFRQSWGQKSFMQAGAVQWDDDDLGVTNTSTEFLVNHFSGNWGGDFIFDETNDSQRDKGRRRDFDLMYQDANFFASVGHQLITRDFLPRIGFAPQRGFEGWNAFLGGGLSYTNGPISSWNTEMFFTKTNREGGGGVFLDSAHMGLSLVTRQAIGVDMGWDGSNFLGSKADLYNLSFTLPANNPNQFWSVAGVAGDADGSDYRLYNFSANYRLPSRITISPALQFEKFGSDKNHQHVVGVNYDIDRDRSISGRVVSRTHSTNWYVAYRRSGNIGAEWFVILGDPNAEKFRKSIIIKAVIPMTLKF